MPPKIRLALEFYSRSGLPCPPHLQANIKESKSHAGEEVAYLPKEMFNLEKCAVCERGNTVGVDLEVIRLEEAERGWMGRGCGLTWALTCAPGFRVWQGHLELVLICRCNISLKSSHREGL